MDNLRLKIKNFFRKKKSKLIESNKNKERFKQALKSIYNELGLVSKEDFLQELDELLKYGDSDKISSILDSHGLTQQKSEFLEIINFLKEVRKNIYNYFSYDGIISIPKFNYKKFQTIVSRDDYGNGLNHFLQNPEQSYQVSLKKDYLEKLKECFDQTYTQMANNDFAKVLRSSIKLKIELINNQAVKDALRMPRLKHLKIVWFILILLITIIISGCFLYHCQSIGQEIWQKILCLRWGGEHCATKSIPENSKHWSWLFVLLFPTLIGVLITEYRKQMHNYLKYDFAWNMKRTADELVVQTTGKGTDEEKSAKEFRNELLKMAFNNLETGYSKNPVQTQTSLTIKP